MNEVSPHITPHIDFFFERYLHHLTFSQHNLTAESYANALLHWPKG